MTRLAIVTGASAGIGEATARRLAAEGWRQILVARRGDRLEQLAAEIGNATALALDLTDPSAPAAVAAAVAAEGGQLHLLVNNAGAAWRGTFAETGWANVERHMRLDFESPVRLTEALLPILRASAPSSIVNVASTAGRVARPRSGAYSAAKFALAGWTDALHAEEASHGVHIGLVLPGFIATEGFPATELLASVKTRWLVSTADRVAEAILEAGPGGRAERYVPRGYWVFAAIRILLPRLTRRMVGGGAFTTATNAQE